MVGSAGLNAALYYRRENRTSQAGRVQLTGVFSSTATALTRSRLASTGSGRSRDASAASSLYPRRFSSSTTCCLLYCSMSITKSLRQPDATGAHAPGG